MDEMSIQNLEETDVCRHAADGERSCSCSTVLKTEEFWLQSEAGGRNPEK